MRDLAVSYAGVYLFLGLGLGLGLRLGLGLIVPTSRANLVPRVIWQCDIFGTTPVPLPCFNSDGTLLTVTSSEKDIKQFVKRPVSVSLAFGTEPRPDIASIDHRVT